MQLICDLLRQCSWIHGSSDDNVLEAKIHDWMLPIQADDLWLRREHEATISKIGYDANDHYISIVSCGCAGADLEKARWSDMNLLTDRIGIRKVFLPECAIDQRHRLCVRRVRFGKISTPQKRNSQRP